MKLEIDNGSVNDLQVATLHRFLRLTADGGTIDILVRRNGQDHQFEGDFLRHIKIVEPWPSNRNQPAP